MYNEDEYNELKMTIDCHQNDVAQFIDESETLEELTNELKSYFKLTDEYYEEREYWCGVVKKSTEKSDV